MLRITRFGLTINDLLQSIKTGNSTIDLSSSMVRNDNAITPNLNTFLSISHALDALDGKWLATAHLLPRLDEPGNLLPAVSSAVPDVVNPLGTCFVRLLFGIDAVFSESLLEDRVAQAEVGAEAVVEGVVAGGDIVVSPAELPSAVIRSQPLVPKVILANVWSQ